MNPIFCINLSSFEWQSCHVQQLTLFSDIDDCSPDPCQNNATCVDGVNDYTCNCTAGYDGKNCSQSKLNHFPPLPTITREHNYLVMNLPSFIAFNQTHKMIYNDVKICSSSPKKQTLYFASLAPVSIDKVAMFNSYLYFQISMIIATLILA